MLSIAKLRLPGSPFIKTNEAKTQVNTHMEVPYGYILLLLLLYCPLKLSTLPLRFGPVHGHMTRLRNFLLMENEGCTVQIQVFAIL